MDHFEKPEFTYKLKKMWLTAHNAVLYKDVDCVIVGGRFNIISYLNQKENREPTSPAGEHDVNLWLAEFRVTEENDPMLVKILAFVIQSPVAQILFRITRPSTLQI
jgi:hypothetical protein